MANEYPPTEFYRAPSIWNNIIIGGACFRWDQKTSSGLNVIPRVHANEAHFDVGITKLYLDRSEDRPSICPLVISSDSGGLPIITMLASPDETMGRMGVTAGLSGGSPITNMFLFKNGAEIDAGHTALYHKYANIWVFWIWWGGENHPAKELIDDVTEKVTAMESKLVELFNEIVALKERVGVLEALNVGPRLITLENHSAGVLDRLSALETWRQGMSD